MNLPRYGSVSGRVQNFNGARSLRVDVVIRRGGCKIVVFKRRQRGRNGHAVRATTYLANDYIKGRI